MNQIKPTAGTSARRGSDALPFLISAALAAGWLLAGSAVESRAEDIPESPADVLRERRIEGIRDRVSIHLRAAGGNLAGAEIAVDADREGTVTLTGRVGSDEARTRAGRLAKYAVGVRRVENRLGVDPSIAAPPPVIEDVVDAPVEAVPEDDTDEAVARRLGEALASEIGSGAAVEKSFFGGWVVEGEDWEFSIEVDESQVVLEGTVPATQDIARLSDVASKSVGVDSVATDLEPIDAEEEDEGSRFFFGLF